MNYPEKAIPRTVSFLNELPYLTAEMAGIGGVLRSRPEDFRVSERPLYLPCGEGEHLYLRITKRGLSTTDLVLRLSSILGIKAMGIGVAGLKDSNAVTTQMVSLHGVRPDAVGRIRLDDHVLAVEMLGRHRNRLRTGHHAGNEFTLVVRGVAQEAAEVVPAVLEVLQKRGVPNYFGPQRQGRKGDNFLIGAQLLVDPQRRARLSRSKRQWYLNAYQSHLFNRILARRIQTIDRLLSGEWAAKVANGACFRVEEPAVEQPRCDAFEVSPTAPLFGSRTEWANGEAGAIEAAAVAECGATRDGLTAAARACGFRGERRSLRILMTNSAWSMSDQNLTISFALPPGAYATSVLREFMKQDSQ
ncbi:tRNA pseudouridine synthase D [Nitrospira sp.]|nr:tRNA pseudouridine synthase D [Nitrospira sp.]